MFLCTDCYQDYFLDEEVIEIHTSKDAHQVLSKIILWLKTMISYGDKQYIKKFYTHYYTEMRYYEDKLKELNLTLSEAEETDNFKKYPEVKENGFALLKELMDSNVMRNYQSHLSQTLINIKNKEVF